MSNENVSNIKPTGAHTAKFIIVSLIGIALFLVPFRIGEVNLLGIDMPGETNIVLGHIITWLTRAFRNVHFTQYSPDSMAGNFALHYLLALAAITISFVGTLVAWIAKPKFIMENERLKDIFHCNIVYFISKLLGFVFIWLIFLSHFGVGSGVAPVDWVVHSFTGDVIVGLVASLMIIFLIIVPFMPLITEFGLMEFIGIGIRRVVRALFTLPGRASVDLMASWFGSSAASIIITRGQHERGFYTGREAAVIAVNFSFVSLPFTFVVANTMGLGDFFLWFYLVMCLTCVILGLLLPRIWPLRQLPDTYLEEVGKQITEDDKPEGVSRFSFAVENASRKAAGARFGDVAKSAGRSYVNIFMDLIPIIMAWGTIGAMLVELTPIFNTIGRPFGWLMNLLGLEGGLELGHLALVGFIDMFLPALMIGEQAVMTAFVIGVLSIVQIIYMAETGVLIAKSKMPLGVGKLFIIFLMRTIIGLPIIVGLTHLFVLLGALSF
jgi:nucleoside recognition membrane protein YjiH